MSKHVIHIIEVDTGPEEEKKELEHEKLIGLHNLIATQFPVRFIGVRVEGNDE